MRAARARHALQLILLVVAAVALAPTARAAARPGPGSLDPSFGHRGRVLVRSTAETTPADFTSPAVAPDGDLVAEVKRQTHAEGTIREIEERRPNGALDRSFGGDGRVRVEAGHGLAVLPDGDIAVGADRCGGKSSAALLLDPAGAPVRSYGDEGCAAAVGFAEELIAVDAEGRVIVAGAQVHCPPCGKDYLPHNEPVIARLLPDGSALDPSFGTAGQVTGTGLGFPTEGTGAVERPAALAATPTGGVELAAGQLLIRLTGAGALDTGYGNGGVAKVPGYPDGFFLEADGSADVLSSGGRPYSVFVSRIDPTGVLDPSFGTAGSVELPSGHELMPGGIAAAPGGGVLLSGGIGRGDACPNCTGQRILERLTAAGQPDRSFGSHGVVTFTSPAPIHSGFERMPVLAAAPDGSAFVVGGNGAREGSIAAWTPAGRPRRSFGKAGVLTVHYAEPALLAPTGMTVAPDGGLTVLNDRRNAPGLISGYLTRFGAGGGQRRFRSGALASRAAYHGLAVPLGNGGTVVWEPPESEQTTFVLRALAPGGAPLASFGENGEATLPEGLVPWEVVPAPGGGIAVVGGYGKGQMAVYRLGVDGRPVPGFGHRGLAWVTFPKGGATGYGGLVEADGDVVVIGSVGPRFAAARFLPDGRLDPGFGRGGLVTLGVDGGIGDLVAPWRGGVVIDAIHPDPVGNTSVGLIRLDRHGRLVRDFGRHGIARPVPEKTPLALFTGGGRIVVVTDPVFEKGHEGGGVELRSYKPDGSVDRAFGTDGVRSYGAGADEEHRFNPVAAVQGPSGDVVVAGERRLGHRSRTELVRFLLR